MSSQVANSPVSCSKKAASACSMPPSVSSEKTTPNPKVSSAAFLSHSSIAWRGLRSLSRVAR
jgi:hypothetical protein